MAAACPLGAVRPRVDTLLLDLDDTLYRVEAVPELVRERIMEFMVDRLAIDPAAVPDLCTHYYTNYGTTLAGLVAASDHVPHAPSDGAGRAFYDEWHAAVHATLPLETMLRPDPAVRSVLASLPQRLLIFTNADRAHAVRCLELLELRDLFPDVEKDIICFETIMDAASASGLVRRGRPVVAKPSDAAVLLALAHAGVAPGEEATVAFFDDSARNVAACAAAGVASVLVGRTGVFGVDAVAQVASVADLARELPSLWTAHGLTPPPPRPAADAAADAAAAAMAAGLETLDQVRNALPDPRRRASLDSAAGSPR